VRERAAAIDVAQRKDAGDVGGKLIVDRDEAARVGRYAGAIEPKVVGVRDASDGEQQMRTGDVARIFVAAHRDGDAFRTSFGAQAFCVEPDGDALAFENGSHGLRHRFVFARDQSRRHLDHGHATAEAAIHLGEFEPDIAAADHDQVLGQEIDLHHAGAGQVIGVGQATEGRHRRPAAGVDEYLGCQEKSVANAHGVRAFETPVALNDRDIRRATEPLLHIAGRLTDDVVLARLHARHIDANATVDRDAEQRRMPGDVSGAGACDQRLGRDASGIDARTAEALALENRGLAAGFRQRTANGGPAWPVPMTIASNRSCACPLMLFDRHGFSAAACLHRDRIIPGTPARSIATKPLTV
jgi:hypothetical protein